MNIGSVFTELYVYIVKPRTLILYCTFLVKPMVVSPTDLRSTTAVWYRPS